MQRGPNQSICGFREDRPAHRDRHQGGAEKKSKNGETEGCDKKFDEGCTQAGSQPRFDDLAAIEQRAHSLPDQRRRHETRERDGPKPKRIIAGVAFAYGQGRNEELIASAVKGHRSEYVIASKFGNLRAADGSPTSDGRPEYVKQCCERSLKRLETDVLDLYYIHRVDPTIPIEDTVGAMSDLVREGKVRHLGICEAGVMTIRRAHATHPLRAVQIEYSLWTRDVEAEILPLCEELGIGFVAYSPLGRAHRAHVLGVERVLEREHDAVHPHTGAEHLRLNASVSGALRGTERRYGAGGEDGNFVAACNRWSAAMPQPNDLSRSLVALDQNSTIIAVVELSHSSIRPHIGARRGTDRSSKLPPFWHPVKGGMALEGAHVARKQPEANGASAVTVVDAVDQRRQLLAPAVVGREQVRLMVIGGHQVEQHDADAERFVSRHPLPDLLKTGKQRARVARLVEICFLPPAAEIADPGQMYA